MKFIIHTDGGSRGNPGPGAIGLCVFEGENVIYEEAHFIGEVTNNEAEYQALIHSLEWLERQAQMPDHVTWKLDSKLVVEQVQRNWKIKEQRLRALAQQCWDSLERLSLPYSIQHVPREENACADKLVNQALDAELAS